MKKTPKKKRAAIASSDLLALLRDGKLEVTESNADWVKNAYCEAVSWNSVFKAAGLDYLEDPDRSHDERMYEEWLESAFRDNFETDEQCKNAIQSVRTQVLESLG